MNITHFHLFCGAGGGALGFNQGTARVGSLSARFVCLLAATGTTFVLSGTPIWVRDVAIALGVEQ